ncbi:MAG: carboxypeptidase-like regulatory domain-containing protein, partial [Crocinitomicaceae bacterium]
MRFLLLLACFISCFTSFSQEKATFSGYIKDGTNGETLIGTQIYFPSINKGTTTNAYGFFSISLPKGNYAYEITSLGFATTKDTVVLNDDVSLDINLQLSQHVTKEVVVKAIGANHNTESTEMGTIRLDIEQMKVLPAFLGEVDVISTLKLMPGVSSANEGSQGFYVRGGGPDQNLVLMDGAPVYNASHLFGF